MKNTQAYKNAIELNKQVSESSKQELVNSARSEVQEDIGRSGCQKLSFRMLDEMGKVGTSRAEMNFLIFLASVQDQEGIAVTNVHMMCNEIKCSVSSFNELLHKLEKKGLITYRRSKDWKQSKQGIYYVDLVYNHFNSNFIENPYIRLNHGVFRTEKFYKLTPAAKYVVLKGMFTLNDTKKHEMKSWVNIPFFIELRPLKEETMQWNGCAPRTFDYAVSSVMKNFNGHVESGHKRGQKRNTKGIMLKFTEEELVFKSSDNFSRASNIFSASCEEEGIHICEEITETKRLAEIMYRNKKKAVDRVEEAKKNYQTGLSIMRSSMPKTKEEWDKVNGLTDEFHSIVKSTNEYQENFAFFKSNELTSWGNKLFKGEIIKDEKNPLWFRYIIGKTITSYKFIKTSIKARKWNIKDFNLFGLIEDFLHAFLSNKKMNTNYITKKILSYKLPVAA